MKQDERVKYWLDIVADDLDTAEYLFTGGGGCTRLSCAIK